MRSAAFLDPEVSPVICRRCFSINTSKEQVYVVGKIIMPVKHF